MPSVPASLPDAAELQHPYADRKPNQEVAENADLDIASSVCRPARPDSCSSICPETLKASELRVVKTLQLKPYSPEPKLLHSLPDDETMRFETYSACTARTFAQCVARSQI